MDLKFYVGSTEWDLTGVPAKKNKKIYPCCDYPFIDVTFNMTIQRKLRCYAINVIMPVVSINLLTCVTFFMPVDSGEKISLSVTVLLSLSMFLLLLMETVPATSLKIPLLGKYLLFTLLIVSLSVMFTVLAISVNYRSASTHTMPRIMRRLFLEILPPILLMKRPSVDEKDDDNEDGDNGKEDTYWSFWKDEATNDLRSFSRFQTGNHEARSPLIRGNQEGSSGHENGLPSANTIDPFNIHPYGKKGYIPGSSAPYKKPAFARTTFIGGEKFLTTKLDNVCQACAKRKESGKALPVRMQMAIDGALYIKKHHEDNDEAKVTMNDWIYVAMVIDRFLLWIYITVCIVGGAGILMNAPGLYKQHTPTLP